MRARLASRSRFTTTGLANGGALNKQQKRQVNREQNRNSKQLHNQKHNEKMAKL